MATARISSGNTSLTVRYAELAAAEATKKIADQANARDVPDDRREEALVGGHGHGDVDRVGHLAGDLTRLRDVGRREGESELLDEAFREGTISAGFRLRPWLSVAGGYDYASPNARHFPRVDEWRTSWDVSVNATWLLWDGGRRRAERAEADQILEHAVHAAVDAVADDRHRPRGREPGEEQVRGRLAGNDDRRGP